MILHYTRSATRKVAVASLEVCLEKALGTRSSALYGLTESEPHSCRHSPFPASFAKMLPAKRCYGDDNCWARVNRPALDYHKEKMLTIAPREMTFFF